MRCVLAILVLATLATAARPVYAAGLAGRVVAISPDQGRVTVMPFDRQGFVTVFLPVERWPAGLKPGDNVLIEGVYAKNNRQQFIGSTLSRGRPPPPSRRDPTGVRSRLNRLQ